LAEIERRGGTDVITEEKMARIDLALDEQKRTLDALLVKRARPDLGRGAAQPSAVRQAFDAYVRRGDEAAIAAIGTQGHVGGAATPTAAIWCPTSSTARSAAGCPNSRRSARSPRCGRSPARVLKKPFALNGMATGWVGETDDRPQTAAPQLAELQFPTMELYAMPAATASLIEDSAVDIEGWIASEVEAAFAEQEGAAFVAGDGAQQAARLPRLP
jgi:predicted phage gp36 major capsid-like protein